MEMGDREDAVVGAPAAVSSYSQCSQRRSPTSPTHDSLQSSLLRSKLREVSNERPILQGDSETDAGGENVLKKEITLFTGMSYIVGGMIGSGIFVTPRNILSLSHSFGLSLVVWILGGVIAMLAGFCYIELGLLVKKSGVEYNFLKEAYTFKNRHWVLGILGEVLAFMYLWTAVLMIRSSSMAVVCLTSARYIVRPFYLDEELPEELVSIVAIGIVGECC